MPLKVLCDENLPVVVEALLQKWDFDVLRSPSGISDTEVAAQAKRDQRILITFDSDFSNILAYPPQEYFGIIRLRIHPPFPNIIASSLQNVFAKFKTPEDFQGKLIIVEPDSFRVWGEKMGEVE